MNEREAQERTWEVVRRAFEAHEPRPHKRDLRPLAIVLVAGALLAAAASAPGRALLGDLGDAVDVDKSEPALFSLPAPGRLLVTTAEGAWVIDEDGSRRLLGAYRDAAWSPFGRFVIATRPNELTALEPDGEVRWTLARPRVAMPAWGGTEADTRIAYLSRGRLHVVGGDSEGDIDVGPAAAVRPAWRPGGAHVVAYVDARGRVRVRGAAAPRAAREPIALGWTRGGELVTVRGARKAAVSPTGRVARLHADGRVVVGGRSVFAADTRLGELAWSPDGRWLLLTWPEADQWVFVRVIGQRRVETVSGISRQLGGAVRTVAWGPRDPEET